MATKLQKPSRRVGVGAQYMCFFDPTNEAAYESDVYKSETVTTIGTSEGAASENIWGSNKIYDTDRGSEPPTLTVENVAIEARNRARMLGQKLSGAFVISSNLDDGEFFAYGIVFPKRNGGAEYVWYPRCRASEISNDAQTKDDGGSNTQNPSTSIQCLPFNDAGEYRIMYDTSLVPEGETGLTEEEFFAEVLTAPIPTA